MEVEESESSLQLLQLQEGEFGQLSALVAGPESAHEPVQILAHFGGVFVEAGVEAQEIAAELSHRSWQLLHGEYHQIVHAEERLYVALSGGVAVQRYIELHLRQFQKILPVGTQQFGPYVLFVVSLIGNSWQFGQRFGAALDRGTQVGFLQQFVMEAEPFQRNVH